jgi:lysophospholipase L1-like esterase
VHRLALCATLVAAAVAVPSAATASRAAEGCAVVCHFDVAPGNYEVSVLLGDPDEAAATGVRAEARRMMLTETVTDPGQFVRREFRVNVREPEGAPTKERSGTPGLTLTFTGAAPHVRGVTVRPVRSGPMLFLAGDSTVCDQNTAAYTGWGQTIPQHLPPDLTVANYADPGDSSASFLAEPRLWDTMLPQVHRGDPVLLQFGHNERTTTADDYRDNLTRMVAELRTRYARPVLVSPPVRRAFNSTTGHLNATALHVNGIGVDLPAEMAAVAAEQDVPYINLTAASAALVEGLGIEGSKQLYLSDELSDNTHFSEYGADQFGLLVLEGLREVIVAGDSR